MRAASFILLYIAHVCVRERAREREHERSTISTLMYSAWPVFLHEAKSVYTRILLKIPGRRASNRDLAGDNSASGSEISLTQQLDPAHFPNLSFCQYAAALIGRQTVAKYNEGQERANIVQVMAGHIFQAYREAAMLINLHANTSSQGACSARYTWLFSASPNTLPTFLSPSTTRLSSTQSPAQLLLG